MSRAKLPSDLHQHDLRHRRVTTWLAAGGDAVKVKEAMGHADLRTTMDYTHLVRENLPQPGGGSSCENEWDRTGSIIAGYTTRVWLRLSRSAVLRGRVSGSPAGPLE